MAPAQHACLRLRRKHRFTGPGHVLLATAAVAAFGTATFAAFVEMQAAAPRSDERDAQQSRRRALVALAVASAPREPAAAFENREAGVEQRRKRQLFAEDEGKEVRMVMPGGGSGTNKRQLPECPMGRASANCFSSTALRLSGAKINPWVFHGKASAEEAMRELREVVDAYLPGQSGIDGGGFKVAQQDSDYLMVNYESRRFGYIDDVEFFFKPQERGAQSTEPGVSGRVLVRSASRLGEADFGVNAVRLNRLAADLRAKGGWEAPAITQETHPKYWEANCPLPGSVLPC
ncbi:unnamed protein product [Polarella glacialis]|uniref:Uncharacterized protein n=1 Tax=Polarella glacialis TaxID=89957 RepID=A0A813E0B8_POLGL|nr:unnamed protein product [Polarella glacialis]